MNMTVKCSRVGCLILAHYQAVIRFPLIHGPRGGTTVIRKQKMGELEITYGGNCMPYTVVSEPICGEHAASLKLVDYISKEQFDRIERRLRTWDPYVKIGAIKDVTLEIVPYPDLKLHEKDRISREDLESGDFTMQAKRGRVM